MYQKLLNSEHVAQELLALLKPPYPNLCKPNLTCEYHASVEGHNIHTCNTFKAA